MPCGVCGAVCVATPTDPYRPLQTTSTHTDPYREETPTDPYAGACAALQTPTSPTDQRGYGGGRRRRRRGNSGGGGEAQGEEMPRQGRCAGAGTAIRRSGRWRGAAGLHRVFRGNGTPLVAILARSLVDNSVERLGRGPCRGPVFHRFPQVFHKLSTGGAVEFLDTSR